MTDKVQRIREEVVRLRNLHQMKYQQLDADSSMSLVECGKRNLCNELLSYIDSLQEEQKPSWSEEDGKYTNIIVAALCSPSMEGLYCFHKVRSNDIINWFKSLKDRELPQPRQEWSEEDDDDAWLNDIISKAECNLQLNKDEIDWLKSLKDRVQPQPEWSEEDERTRINTIELLETANHPNKMHSNGKPLDFTENINWLKSLRPQSRRKPSGEQIKVCKEVYADLLSAKGFDISTVNSELNRMEEQLKKLREEL